MLKNRQIFEQIHFLLYLSTKYATVKSPAIVRRASNPDIRRRVGLGEDFSVGTAEGFKLDEGSGLDEDVGIVEIVGVITGVGVDVIAGDLSVELGVGSVRTI